MAEDPSNRHSWRAIGAGLHDSPEISTWVADVPRLGQNRCLKDSEPCLPTSAFDSPSPKACRQTGEENLADPLNPAPYLRSCPWQRDRSVGFSDSFDVNVRNTPAGANCTYSYAMTDAYSYTNTYSGTLKASLLLRSASKGQMSS